MDILIYAKPEQLDHKLHSKVSKTIAYCFWRVSRIPSRDNTWNINKVYFSDGEKIIAEGLYRIEETELEQAICFLPLKRVNKKQPKKPPTRGWCYINKEA